MFRRLAFWLLLFLVFTVPWEYLYRVDDMTMVSRAVGVVVAGAWALAALAAGRLRRPGTLLVLMALFVAWCVASIVWSVDSELSIRQAITYLQLLMLAVILWDLVQTERELRLTLQAYVLGSWVVVARLVETYLTGDVMRRFTVGEFNQNTLGLVLALALPMAWYLASSARARRAAGESDLTLYLRLPNLAFIPGAAVRDLPHQLARRPARRAARPRLHGAQPAPRALGLAPRRRRRGRRHRGLRLALHPRSSRSIAIRAPPPSSPRATGTAASRSGRKACA